MVRQLTTEVLIKFLRKYFLVLQAPDPWANIHEKLRNLRDSYEKSGKCKNRKEKNDVSICDDSSTKYEFL